MGTGVGSTSTIREFPVARSCADSSEVSRWGLGVVVGQDRVSKFKMPTPVEVEDVVRTWGGEHPLLW